MAKAKKLPSGNWRVQLYAGMENGKRLYKSFTAPTKKEAEYMAAQFAAEKKENAEPSNMTIGEAIEKYIESKSNILSPSTLDGYQSIRRNAFQSLMNVKLKDLTESLFQRAVNEETKHLSPKTVMNRYVLLLSAIELFMPNFKAKITLPRKTYHEICIPQNNELVALFDFVRKTPLEIPVALAACMGLRRSEICALTWNDYDPVARTLIINKAMVLDENNLYVIKPPKSYAGNRTLVVPDIVCAMLNAATSKEGNITALNPNMLSHRYNNAVQKIGINIGFHALRHYYASTLLALGVPDKYAMERMGHATPNMLKNVYQHTMVEKQKQMDSAINNVFSGILQHEIQHDT